MPSLKVIRSEEGCAHLGETVSDACFAAVEAPDERSEPTPLIKTHDFVYNCSLTGTLNLRSGRSGSEVTFQSAPDRRSGLSAERPTLRTKSYDQSDHFGKRFVSAAGPNPTSGDRPAVLLVGPTANLGSRPPLGRSVNLKAPLR